MEKTLYDNYLAILKNELIVAMGCTEPIAIAFAGAKARSVLGREPESCIVSCSGNMIKNVKGVIVPQSGGKRGIDVAAALGIVGGAAERKLDVLATVTPEDREKAEKLLENGFCRCELKEDVDNLYIDLKLFAAGESAEVEISNYHTNITRIVKNGVIIFENDVKKNETGSTPDKMCLNLKNILKFGDCVKMSDVQEMLDSEITFNRAISEEGLRGQWGAQVGRTILQSADRDSIKAQACAAAAAGSDARMAGCALPVVINSGSGNQGITITMPILTFAEKNNIPKEKMYRALCVANLIAIHQKKYIGNLSAYCGAVSAACASACGIAYMMDEDYGIIADTITNTICTVGGIVCDGAKSSCAAKIAAAVNAALTAHDMAKNAHVFQPGEGLTGTDVEKTIETIGCMGREGMHSTDVKILNLMLSNR